MLFEVQNYNTLCNPLVCPLSDRAVRKYENLEEGVLTLDLLKQKVLVMFLIKSGRGRPSAPPVPTALSDIRSTNQQNSIQAYE